MFHETTSYAVVIYILQSLYTISVVFAINRTTQGLRHIVHNRLNLGV